MKKTNRNAFRSLLKRHLVAICIILACLFGAGGFLFWQNNIVSAKIAQTNAATKKMIAETDLKIKESLAKKATEEQAKKDAQEKAAQEAEEKAKQEAATKEAANQSIATDSTGLTTTDPNSCNNSKIHNTPASIDVMVNKKHCIQPLSYVPADLVTTNGATLSAKAINSYNQMFAAASAAGQGFGVTSSYRSYNTQISTYNYWVSTSGQAGADTYSARPGYSEHQTGLVMDVSAGSCVLDCFGTTSQYQWLQQNAANYGFIQRYYAG